MLQNLFSRLKKWWYLREIIKDFEKNYLMADVVVNDFNNEIKEKDAAYEENMAELERKEEELEKVKELLKTSTGEGYKANRDEVDALTAEVSMFEERNAYYATKERKQLEAGRGEARRQRDEKKALLDRYSKVIKGKKYDAGKN